MNAADGQSIVVIERAAARDAAGAAFRILRIALGGDTLVNRTVAYVPKVIEPDARTEAYRSLAERLSRRVNVSGSVSDLQADVRRALGTPRFLPPVTELVTGRDGTIWLRREEVPDSAEWHVFGPSGDERGRVKVPTTLKVYGAEAGRFWGVVRDAFDVQYVEVYRINR